MHSHDSFADTPSPLPPIPLPCIKSQSSLFSAICERLMRSSSLFFKTLGSDGLENNGVKNLLKNSVPWKSVTSMAADAVRWIAGFRGASPGAKARPLFCGICGPAEAVPFLQSSFTRMRLHGQQDSGDGSPGAKARPLFCGICGPRPTHWVGSPAVPFLQSSSTPSFSTGFKRHSRRISRHYAPLEFGI